MAVAYCVCCIVLLATATVKGFSIGAPEIACANLVPAHPGSPSVDPPPYEVNISQFDDQTYVPGQLYNITLRSLKVPGTDSDNIRFKGFIIQGRRVSDNSSVGTWEIPASVAARTACSSTAATHVSNVDKKSIILRWKAPPAGNGAIRFRYAFVRTFTEYWANLFTDIIQEASQATTTSSSLSTSTSTTIVHPTAVVILTRISSTSITSTSLTSSNLQTTSSFIPISRTTTSTTTTTTTTSTTSTTSVTISSTSTPSTTTTPPTIPSVPISCKSVTGFPMCSPDYCSGFRSRFSRCSVHVDSCLNQCQVTICKACIYTDHSVTTSKVCEHRRCRSLKCLIRWSKCVFKEISKFQLKKADRKPENFKCFVPLKRC